MVKLKIGISSCLLGQPVRYNGGHKRNQTVIDLLLDDRFEAVPVCPEVEMGMGIPREPVQIVADHLVGVETQKDWTDVMTDFNSGKLKELTSLSGFIFKTRSPSCGIQAVHQDTSETTSGLFARAFMKHFPHIPVIDEEQLQDNQSRENFIARLRREEV
ncbi:MAG: DUF523 domain-containing protein [Nitrospinae bacterium]|nr:DUF523 domain-containing protein [Nitrospinota bacterium]MBL7021469.1 DUF523 domain-containing protein [Nitrospinaceae bacterium]